MVAQNRIKTALRNRLTTSRLNVLMTIDIEGPTLRKFDFIWLTRNGAMKSGESKHEHVAFIHATKTLCAYYYKI